MAGMRASEGIQKLIDMTGGPRVVATVTVDQVYAADQHETLYYKHPRGGRAKYLEAPMFEEYAGWLQNFADHLLLKQGTAERRWAEHVGRPLKAVVAKNAPRALSDLRRSAALVVKAGSAIILDEPPLQHRLSREELGVLDDWDNVGPR